MFRKIEAYSLIKKSGLFDAKYYYQKYPDVRRADVDPLLHFIQSGWKEGRNPSETFLTNEYTDMYEDVRSSGLNPLVHYLKVGKKEGRLTRNITEEETEGNLVVNASAPKTSSRTNMQTQTGFTYQYEISTDERPGSRFKRKIRDLGRNIVMRLPGVRLREFLLKIGRDYFPNNALPDPKINKDRASKENLSTAIYHDLLKNSQPARNEFVPYSEQGLSLSGTDVKLIAFYLPQFHTIPENDRWWGKGFTEWTNVTRAVPQFPGHYQPHLPGDVGFYDLRVSEAQEFQVELAKNYGIFGFCYYFYWFNGKRLLEKPLDNHLNNPNIDFPFCICWANENWTRRWDGLESDVLISQDYTDDHDLALIKDLSVYFSSNKYIRIEGRPVLVVYRAQLLPNPKKTTEIWRRFCIENGFENPYLIAAESFGNSGDPGLMGFDAALEFPPHYLSQAQIDKRKIPIANQDFSGNIYDYNLALKHMTSKSKPNYTLFKTTMTSWDNTARKQNNANIFINANPQNYQAWLEKNIEYTNKNFEANKRFIFINAWNEWAEGAHLEPDRKFGYGYLAATANALRRFSKTHIQSSWTILFVGHDAHLAGAQLSLLSILKWFQEHTAVNVKVLLLEQGQLLKKYQEVTDVLPFSDISKLTDAQKLDEIMRFCEKRPDLIYLNSIVSGKAINLLKDLNIPILTHIRELQSSIIRYGKDWVSDVFRFSTYFNSCSNHVRSYLLEQYHVPPENCYMTYSFIEPAQEAFFLSAEAKTSLRSKLGIPQKQTVIFGCGVGMPFRKGADLFIDLARQLLKLNVRDFHLYWIGNLAENEIDSKHGVWKDFLEGMRKEGLDQWITFLESNDNPRDFFPAGDIFALTSREEPLGRVILEAADCGLPTICFAESGGPPEFVRQDAGYIVPPENTAAMAEKIVFLKNNENIRKDMGNIARKRVLEEFSANAVAPQIFSLCRKLTQQKPAVSVIVPNFNHARYLHERLESIYQQTFQDFEVILLDDASTDKSMEIIQSYQKHPYTTIIANQENSKAAFKQWQKGLQAAKSDIIWLAESDDVCELNFLATLLPAFFDPEIKLAYSASMVIDENGVQKNAYREMEYLQSLSETKWKTNYCVSAEQEINDGLGIKNTILNMSAVLFRRIEFTPQFINQMLSMRSGFDTHFILNLIKGSKIYYESRILNYHRRHSKSIVGKLLTQMEEDEVQTYFKNLAINYRYVIHNYKLQPVFLERFDDNIARLLTQLGGNRDDTHEIFPLQEIRNEIIANINGISKLN
jgi:glycosyltransferase involved in cell wall biosynthesis